MSAIIEHSPATPEDFDMTPATAEEIAADDAAGVAMHAAADDCMDSIEQLSMGIDFGGEKKRLIKYLQSVHTRFNSPGFEITAELCAEMLLAHSDYSKILKEFEDSGKADCPDDVRCGDRFQEPIGGCKKSARQVR